MTEQRTGRPTRPGPRPAAKGTRPRPTVSRTSARRFARRQWRRRLRRARPILIAVALVLVAGFSVWAVWFSTLFDVRTVTVRGLPQDTPLTLDDVRTAAGVEPGIPLIAVDLDRARSDVLEDLPALNDANVNRSWPHEIVVEVTERTPVAVVRTRDGGPLQLVDSDGFPFRTVSQRPVDLLLVEPESGYPVLDADTRRSAVQVVLTLPKQLRDSVVSVSAKTPDSVRLHMLTGTSVLWGSAEQPKAKATVLRALWKQRPPEEVEVYDVSVPSYPTVEGR